MPEPLPSPASEGGRPRPNIEQFLPLFRTGGLSYFGYRMVLASRLFDRRIQQILGRHSGLTLPQWRVLSQLGLSPEGTVRSLADGAAVDRAEVSRVLRELEDRGFVTRRIDEADRRRPLFSLTPAGTALFQHVRAPIGHFIQHLVDDVAAADLEAADRVLWAVTSGCLSDDSF